MLYKSQKIIIKQQAMLHFLGKPGKDAPVAMTLGITHLNDRSLYIFSE